MEDNWIDINIRKPKHEQKVLIYLPNEGEKYRIETATFIKGISEEERSLMKQGKLKDLSRPGWCASEGWTHSKRSSIYANGDIFGNNTVPYEWNGQGPMKWFGQDVSYWMELPIEPKSK